MKSKVFGNVYSFDTAVAAKYDERIATFVRHFQFWIEHNAANKRNQHEGRTWTYNSVQAFKKLFPYLTGDQIRRTLEKMENEEIIISGNFNKDARDRTKWFAFKDESKWFDSDLAILPNANDEKPKSDLAILPNGNGESAKPLPDSKQTDSKPDTKPSLNAGDDPGSSDSIVKIGFWQIDKDKKKKLEKAIGRITLSTIIDCQAEGRFDHFDREHFELMFKFLKRRHSWKSKRPRQYESVRGFSASVIKYISDLKRGEKIVNICLDNEWIGLKNGASELEKIERRSPDQTANGINYQRPGRVPVDIHG